MLKIEHLSKTFGKKQILKDATFTFQEGGIYSLLGGNGSGRTVLLQCIANELSYDGGTITVDGGWRASLASKHSIWPVYLTGYQLIKTISRHKDANEILDRVNISMDIRNTLIKEYDFTTKKRLQLAMFLVQNPYTMIFDEPFDYCDEEYIDDFLRILQEEKDNHIIIISTGLLDIAKKISEDVLVISDGELTFVKKHELEVEEIDKAIQDMLGEDEDEEFH